MNVGKQIGMQVDDRKQGFKKCLPKWTSPKKYCIPQD